MTDQTIKNLVAQSYKNNLLEQTVVNKIADQLSRKDLKRYIQLLKNTENKKEVYVTTADKLTVTDLRKIDSLFPNKKIVSAIDPSIVSGVKILADDSIYEININRTFHDIISFLSKND